MDGRSGGVLEKELRFNWQLSQQFDLVMQVKKNPALETKIIGAPGVADEEADSVMVVLQAELIGLSEEGQQVRSLGGKKIFTRHIQCYRGKEWCEPIVVADEPLLRFKNYKVIQATGCPL